MLTPDQARENARAVLGSVAGGGDPAQERSLAKTCPTIKALFSEFDRLHVRPKLKPRTGEAYRSIFQRHILPEWGNRPADTLTKVNLMKAHARLQGSRFVANRMLNYLSAMYSWAGAHGFVLEGCNPTVGIERYTERKRERYLCAAELDRLGTAIREAETIGIPWQVDSTLPNAKHAAKVDKRQTPISPHAAGALRLLLFTGARLREILHLRWEHVDLERAALFLPDSKTGRKTIYLNGPSLAVLGSLPRLSSYVFPGESRRKDNTREQPRWDLKRPWEGVRRMAGLVEVRLHDLRHTHASFGVGGGVGLPVIAKLLGHTQIRTTERYSHLDADPVRRASEDIGRRIAAAMGDLKP